MQIWKLNACPKCQGALFVGRDTHGEFLTCGWQRDLAIDQPLPQAKDDARAAWEGITDGCNISPSCFLCPLEDCAWETPNTRRAYLWDQTTLALFEQYKYLGTAKAVAATAKDMQVAERTIYRALKRRGSIRRKMS
jgi:hypothetical protein